MSRSMSRSIQFQSRQGRLFLFFFFFLLAFPPATLPRHGEERGMFTLDLFFGGFLVRERRARRRKEKKCLFLLFGVVW